MGDNTNKLYILTGPPGVGKTTISIEIANRLQKSVLIEGDIIYNFYIGGRIKPWEKDAPLDLFWNNCYYLINSYLENGNDVVFNYIINKEEFLKICQIFKKYEIIFKVLYADKETIIKRDLERPLNCQIKDRSILLLNQFLEYNFEEKYLLNTSKLSIEETINKIL